MNILKCKCNYCGGYGIIWTDDDCDQCNGTGKSYFWFNIITWLKRKIY